MAETFSFHPWKVRELNGISDASNDTGARAGLPENFATAGSYIGYNDIADQGAFLRTKEYYNLRGLALFDRQLSDTRLEGVTVRIETTEEGQFNLYRAVQASRLANNLNAVATDVGHYSVAWRNCGFWAVTMLEQQKLSIPHRVRGFNMGAGVNPKGKFHAAGRITATAVQGAAAVANTVGAQYSVYNNFGDESLIMDSEFSPMVGIGLKWRFGR